MARTAKISLDGTDYTVHAFNIGELERASDIFAGSSVRVPYSIIRIALERAEPKVNGAADTIEPTFDEVHAAFQTIAELSGIKLGNPPGPVAPAQS